MSGTLIAVVEPDYHLEKCWLVSRETTVAPYSFKGALTLELAEEKQVSGMSYSLWAQDTDPIFARTLTGGQVEDLFTPAATGMGLRFPNVVLEEIPNADLHFQVELDICDAKGCETSKLQGVMEFRSDTGWGFSFISGLLGV